MHSQCRLLGPSLLLLVGAVLMQAVARGRDPFVQAPPSVVSRRPEVHDASAVHTCPHIASGQCRTSS